MSGIDACVARSIALSLSVTACVDADGSRAVETQVRDSAGIEIVEHALDSDLPAIAFRLADSSDVVIGRAEGDQPYLFSRVHAATRLSVGHVVIVDAGARELRWFDSTGRHVRTVGRRGSGPGEFGFIGRVVRSPGDTLLIHDSGNRRLTVVAPDGEIAHAVSTAALRDLVDDRSIAFFGVLPDGRHIGTTVMRRTERPGKGLFIDSTVVWIVDREMASADSIAALYRNQSIVREVHEMGTGFELSTDEIEFSPRGSMEVSRDGFYYASGRTHEIEKRAPDGRVTRIIRLDRRRRPVTDSLTDAYRRQILERTPEGRRPATERYLSEVIFADSLPAFSGILVDRADRIWAREWSDDVRQPSRWLVFDPGGRLIGGASLTSGCGPLEIGEDYVLCLVRDDLDVERVELRRLLRVE